MANFFSSLFGRRDGRPAEQVKCEAKDPSNCRFHHTGKFADHGGNGGNGGGNGSSNKNSALPRSVAAQPPATSPTVPDDGLSPAERELAKIKASQSSVGSSPSSLLSEWGGKKSWHNAIPFSWHYQKTNHKPYPHPSNSQTSHFGGNWDGMHYSPPPPPPRSADELDALSAKTDPKHLAAVKALGNYVDSNGVTHDTRVSPLTDKPISRVFNSVINSLMSGVHVSDSEIEATPEWKDAQKRYADYAASLAKKGGSSNSWSDNSKSRRETRDAVYAKMSAPVVTHETNDALKPGESYEVEKGFRFDIVTGLPAGGKNSAFADRLSLEHHARLADSDIVKKLLPGYADGLGANIVHDESTFLNKDILDDTFKKGDPKYGDNIVYPTLGGSSPKLIDFMEQAHKAGYKVHLHLNEIDREKAKGRMLYRMVNTGRYLPLCVFTNTHDAVKAYGEAKEYADSAEWCKSDAGKGLEPKMVESVVNENPKRRVEPKHDYSQYGLFGYSGGGYSGASELETYYIDIDTPDHDGEDDFWDDPNFWNDPDNFIDEDGEGESDGEEAEANETSASVSHDPEAAEGGSASRSGMSIEDILAGKGLRR